jgi:hypothetical protein
MGTTFVWLVISAKQCALQDRRRVALPSHYSLCVRWQTISAEFAAARPELAAGLCKQKLSNCGLARLELDFGTANDAAPTRNVVLLNGTKLV